MGRHITVSSFSLSLLETYCIHLAASLWAVWATTCKTKGYSFLFERRNRWGSNTTFPTWSLSFLEFTWLLKFSRIYMIINSISSYICIPEKCVTLTLIYSTKALILREMLPHAMLYRWKQPRFTWFQWVLSMFHRFQMSFIRFKHVSTNFNGFQI